MKCLSLTATMVLLVIHVHSQSSADSVSIMFRAHEGGGNTLFVPGEFNLWGPNTNGVISPGAPSQMTYDAQLQAHTKMYTFKIHAAGAPRTVGDSVFMYKFNKGGVATGWYPDPLNPEQNAADNNNSVIRLTDFFFFQFYTEVVSSAITRIVVGIVHANGDTITSVKISSGPTLLLGEETDVTASFLEEKRVLNYTFPIPIPKSSFLRIVAFNSNGDSIVYQNSVFEVKQRPMPLYARHGVTKASVQSGDSTTFRLRVPGKEYVVLRIAPSGQPVATADPIVMHKDPSSDNWWVNVKLATNTVYEYLYEIDSGDKKVTDPFGRFVGSYGTQFSTGPGGLAADNFVWTDTTYQRPPLNKLVIYELHIGEFAGGFYGKGAGTAGFTDLKNLLGYFDSLGINAIELMPINDYGAVGKSGHSWGYDLNSYFAIEPAYGTPLELKQLINEAHKRGIAVILDVVFNHQNDTGPLWQMLPDEASNPYFKLNSDLRYNEDGLAFFKDMDHWTSETQELVLNNLKMWIDEYKVDGFRYDYTQGIGWNYDFRKVGILGWSNAIDTLYGGQVYQIAEHLPESPALVYYSGLTGGWHDAFRDELFNEARFENVSLLTMENYLVGLQAYQSNDSPAYPYDYANRTEPVNATVTHDEQSLIFEMVHWQGDAETTAVKRDKLYSTFIFGSLGIPMLWEGQEFSAPRGWAVEGDKLSYRPVEWNYLSTERGNDHYRYYRTLVRQRTFNPALYSGALQKLYRYNSERVLVWGFVDSSSNSKVMFVANMSAGEKTVINVPWLGTGTWYDVFDQNPFQVPVTPVPSMTVAGFSAKVYSNKTDAELGIITSVGGSANFLPEEYSLSQNYPNPFNPNTTITFALPRDGYVTVKVYDMLGREIGVLTSEFKRAGEYRTSFNGTSLSSGVYFCRFEAGGTVLQRKMLLLK